MFAWYRFCLRRFVFGRRQLGSSLLYCEQLINALQEASGQTISSAKTSGSKEQLPFYKIRRKSIGLDRNVASFWRRLAYTSPTRRQRRSSSDLRRFSYLRIFVFNICNCVATTGIYGDSPTVAIHCSFAVTVETTRLNLATETNRTESELHWHH